MDFDLDWQYEELERVADRYLGNLCTTSWLREMEASETGFDRSRHVEMGRMGWWSLASPRDDGSVADVIGLVTLFQAIGRAALPGPHMWSSVMAQQLLGAAGPGHEAMMEGIESGSHVATVALYEESAGHEPESVVMQASEARGGALKLLGRKLFVPHVEGADSVMVLARTGDAPADLTWCSIPVDADGLSSERMRSLSSDPLYILTFDQVIVPPSGVVGARSNGWQLLETVLPICHLAQSAEMVGLADSALEIAVEYAKTRIAFGKPIGSFQAIQHKCADMVSDRDAARFLLYQAACLAEDGQTGSSEFMMAKPYIATACRRICKEAHQILAGHGYVLESPLNYFYRRQKAIEMALGDASQLYDCVASRLLE